MSGQTQNVDSLVSVLETQELNPGEQAELYDKIVVAYGSSNNYEKAIEYAEKGLAICREAKNKSIESGLNEGIGISYCAMGNYERAYPYLEKALDLSIQANDKIQEMSVRQTIGSYYGRLGKYEDALKYFVDALSISENIGDKKQGMAILGNIGVIYIILNPEKAVPYFERMIALADELNMPRAKIRPFHELGRYYTGKKDIQKALEYVQKAVDLSRTYNSIIYEALGLGQLAQIHIDMGDYDKALEYLAESMPVCEKTNDPSILANSWKLMSDIYLKQEQYNECEQAAYKSWQLDSTDLATKSELLFNIAYSDIFLGDNEKAAAYLTAYKKAMEETSDKNFHEALTDTEAKYETEKKELRITSLEKERQLYVYLSIAGVLFAIALGIALRQKIKNTQKEKQLIATRSVLEGEMKERTRLAQDLHDRLSGNLLAVKIELGNHAETLQNVRDKLDNCAKDIRNAAHDLMPASLQFGLKVALEDFAAQFPNVRFHFFGEEKRIDRRMEFVVYCCACELVNNSIKHSGAKEINLQLVQDEKHVTLTVSDDGDGFDEKAVSKGFGLKSLRDRVASCNGKMDISTSPGKGTETTIELKVED
jgi:signal transduction histidine kinase